VETRSRRLEPQYRARAEVERWCLEVGRSPTMGCRQAIDVGFNVIIIRKFMSIDVSIEQRLLEKLGQLSSDQLIAVEVFVDRLDPKDEDSDRLLTWAAMRGSEAVFNAVWDNADDAEYDQL